MDIMLYICIVKLIFYITNSNLYDYDKEDFKRECK